MNLKQYFYDPNSTSANVSFTFGTSGRYPIESWKQWKTISDLESFIIYDGADASAYPGMIVVVIEDSDETKNGMYIINKVGSDAQKSDGTIDESSYTKYASNDELSDGLDTKSDKSTTLSGYGITDAKIDGKGVITLGSNTITPLTANSTLSSSKLDNHSMTIAGTSVNLGGSIAAKTIGSALDSSSPAAYATTAGSANSVAWSNVSDKTNATTSADGLMSSTDKSKLDGIASGAEVNVNADWSATSGDAQILNKPTSISGYGISDAYTKTEVDTALGNKVDKVTGKGLSTNDYTTTEKNKLSSIAAGAEVNVNADWDATSGDAEILNKPTTISGYGITDAYTKTEVDTELGKKVDKVSGKGLSTNDYTTTEKNKLAGIAAGAEVNVNADWDASDGDAKILNKPTSISGYGISDAYTKTEVDTKIANLVDSAPGTLDTLNELAAALGDDPNFATTISTSLGNKVDKVSGKGLSTNDYTTTEKNKLSSIASGAEVNVNADWSATSGDAEILNKPTTLSGYGITDAYTKTEVDTSLGNKVDKVSGKGLSTNDFTNTYKTKLDGIASGAEVNVNADWSATSGDAEILNKPTTIAGYGITDAKIKSGVITLGDNTITPLTASSSLTSTNLDNYSISIAGTSVNLGGSITAKTIGAALDSNSPATYATTAGTANGVAWGNVSGKTNATTTAAGLMSSTDKSKLDGIASGAEVNVNADWDATSGDAQILNKPTTIAGYGITDAKIASGVITLGDNSITPLTSSSNLAWGKLTGVPTSFTPSAHNQAWSTITSTPTTIAGYGITDAKIASGVITLGSNTITPLTASSTLASTNLDNHSVTIAGTSVSLGGSITAKTIGDALTSSNPAAYATTAGSANSVAWSNVSGKTNATTSAAGLMSSTDKSKLDGIASGAEVNVNADWDASDGDAKILNKPTTIAGYGITDAYTKTESDNRHLMFAITESMVTVEKDATKGVSPYSTSYGYTNITINDTSLVSWKEGALYVFVVNSTMAVESAYRNVRVRIGTDGDWKPVMNTSTILSGYGTFTKAYNTTFQYKSVYQSGGALHLQTDNNSNTTYPYLVNTIPTGTLKIDSKGYGARYSYIFPTTDNDTALIDKYESWSSLVNSCNAANTKGVVTPNSGKFYLDRKPLYVCSANIAAGAQPAHNLYQNYQGCDLRYTTNTSTTYVSINQRVFLWLKNFNVDDMSFVAPDGDGGIISFDKLSTKFPSSTSGYIYLYFMGWSSSTWYSLSVNQTQSDCIYRYKPSTGEMILLSTTEINNKADKSTTLSGYGITDAYIDESTSSIVLGNDIITPITVEITTDISNYDESHEGKLVLDLGDSDSDTNDDLYFAINGKYKKLTLEQDIIDDEYTISNALNVLNDNKADKSTTLSGYGITDAYIDESTNSIVLGDDIITPMSIEITTNVSNYDESHEGKLVLDLGDSDSDINDDLYFAINGEYKKLTSEKDIIDDEYVYSNAISELSDKIDDIIDNKANKSTTLSGYGITDAKIDENTITLGSNSIIGIKKGTGTNSEIFNNGGDGSTASGYYSHAEGNYTTASGYYSHAEGNGTTASGYYSHAEGQNTTASGYYSHAEGHDSIASGKDSHCEGYNSEASGSISHAEGWGTIASGDSGSHAEGGATKATASQTHAEGWNTQATATTAHSEGNGTKASGVNSHAEGNSTQAINTNCHAEGNGTTASGLNSHAEGYQTISSNAATHAEGWQTTASGTEAHAEGYSTTASGNFSHAEGKTAKATGETSHAEGLNTTASGKMAHAEGNATTASANDAHAEGYQTTASGVAAHAEGYSSNTTKYPLLAKGDYSHAEGYQTQATAQDAHSEGGNTVASGQHSHAEGWKTTASGHKSHTEGQATIASGENSHAEGWQTTASENYTHAEGNATAASGLASHAEGESTTASGNYTHAEGNATTASIYCSHAEGEYTTASGYSAHSEGSNTIASAYESHAEGLFTTAQRYAQHAQGCYNVLDTDGSPTSYSADADALIIGNGTSDSARSNAFSVTFSGAVSVLSAYNSSGADYAEYFEWADGNQDDEDRIGHFVALVNGKIKVANAGEDIIGVVSGMSSIIGNANEDMYHDMYVRDVFGRFIYEDVEVERETGEFEKDDKGNYKKDENGEMIPVMETVTEHRIKLNPDYDSTKEYIPRSERKEWDVIGLLGQLIVIDDGTCVAGSRCSVKDGGIATSGTDYRVMKRIDDTHILILANFI